MSMENSDQVDCQRSIAKSGYTTFSDCLASAVITECQHVYTDLGVIPIQPQTLKIISKGKVNTASQNQDIHSFHFNLKLGK